jgi:hypothetical protein
MELDHSEATARLTLDGLFLFFINERNECEIRALNAHAHHHSFNIVVKELGHDGEFHTIHEYPNFSGGLQIGLSPERVGVTKYEPPDSGLTPGGPRGGSRDPEDFRWVADLEGELFHDNKLEVDPRALSARVTLTDGIIYTQIKTFETFDRVTVDVGDPRPIGKIADMVGVDLVCPDAPGSAVVLVDSRGGKPLSLPREKVGKDGAVWYPRYEISVRNMRTVFDSNARDSDFILYYHAVKDVKKNVKYDLRRPRKKDLKGGYPLVCDPVYLGRTSRI